MKCDFFAAESSALFVGGKPSAKTWLHGHQNF